MAAVRQFDVTGRFVDGHSPIHFGTITSLSSDATASSVCWVRIMLRSAVAAATGLLTQLTRLDVANLLNQCHKLETISLCPKLALLTHGTSALLSILNRLSAFDEVLEEGLDEWVGSGRNSSADHPYPAALITLQIYNNITERQMTTVQGMRQAVEVLVGPHSHRDLLLALHVSLPTTTPTRNGELPPCGAV